jgi:hypothetical protein
VKKWHSLAIVETVIAAMLALVSIEMLSWPGYAC